MSKSRPPRILFLTTDYPPDLGGLQTYSHRIARSLPGGMIVGIAVGSNHPSAALPPLAAIPLRAFRGRDRLRAAAWSFRAVLGSRLHGRIDCSLHMQWSTALGPWLLAKAGRPMPYVILIHGAELLDPGRPLLARLKASVFAEAAAVVAGSRATADLFTSLGLRARRLEVIHYGNPMEAPFLSEPRRRSTGSIRILAMHRLVARKGTSLLLDSLAGMGSLDWRLDLVGRGEEETALRAQATALGLADRIRFLPPVSESVKADLLRDADLFVLPSLPPENNNHMEGLGLTLLEAQSLGLPVLAARTGGIPEAVDEGRTGLLFTPGDAADLKEKLSALIGDRKLRETLGAAGPGWVAERFDWGKSLERLAGVLREAAGG